VKSSKEQYLFENINPKCNILNVFTVIFDQCNVSLMSKGINFLEKNFWPQTFEQYVLFHWHLHAKLPLAVILQRRTDCFVLVSHKLSGRLNTVKVWLNVPSGKHCMIVLKCLIWSTFLDAFCFQKKAFYRRAAFEIKHISRNDPTLTSVNTKITHKGSTLLKGVCIRLTWDIQNHEMTYVLNMK